MTFQQPSPPNHGSQGPFGLGAPTGPGQAVRGRRRWLKYGAVALVSLFVGVGIGNNGGAAESGKETADAKAAPRPTVTVTETAEAAAPEPAPTVTETVTAEPKQTKAPGPATSFSGEGEYLVGEDIKAGTYKTAGPDGAFGCYWERAKDASGEFGSIIANNNLNGPGRVTLNSGEYFKTNRCQEWTRAG
ncbi:hypothetical protein [Streptomyces sp. PSKA30]|uniref:hypothetical protein n=1 Tax=Streptomyces sp. PSKA30 TaxID=2874597 RepID=UPI001CD18465|nr:hypothetical protein [Streptomyces sp. PSKA30]MBZ9645322.1 hypothetical protein [Streptomyces sp. PSKA30]